MGDCEPVWMDFGVASDFFEDLIGPEGPEARLGRPLEFIRVATRIRWIVLSGRGSRSRGGTGSDPDLGRPGWLGHPAGGIGWGILAESALDLAKDMEMTVIAEGAETAAQVEFLRALRCDQVQGYYFSQPLDPDQATAFLKERK